VPNDQSPGPPAVAAPTDPGLDPSSMTPERARLAALTVASALLLQNVDGLTTALALPAIAASLGVETLALSLALIGYMIALSVFIPPSGWISDRFGARRVFCLAMASYALGGVAASLAESVPQLVLARIAQGASAALTVPVGRLLLLRAVPKRQLLQAMTWFTMPALVGPIVGPPLGGLIVTHGSWRLVFLLPVPVALIGILLALRYLPRQEAPRPAAFDGWGFLLVAVAITGLVLGCQAIGQPLLPRWIVAGLFVASAVGSLLYARHLRRHTAPVLVFDAMAVPSFRASFWSGIPLRIGVGAVPLLLPLMLQLGFGYSAADAGFATLAQAVGALGMKPIASRAIGRWGFRSVLVANGLFCAVTVGLCALFGPDTHWLWLSVVLVLGGTTRSLQFTAINTLAYADIEPKRMSAANSMYSMMQQVTLALGLALAAGSLGLLPLLRGAIEARADDYRVTFLLVAVTQVAMVLPLFQLARDAGSGVSGARTRR